MKTHRNIITVVYLLLAAMFPALLFSAPANATPPANPANPANPADQAGDVLLRYQLALDQLSDGEFNDAQETLEEGIRLHGDQPELNLLLAYLLRRDGQNEQALDRLAKITATSPVAAALATQIRDGAQQLAASGAASKSTQDTQATAASSTQTNARLAQLEKAMAQLVNEERAKNKLPALVFDEKLANVARAHAVEMRDLKYFLHESPTPRLRTPLQRYRIVFGSTPRLIAENIFRAWGGRRQMSEKDIKAAHESLMSSPGHRSNILLPGATHIGIGLASNANGDLWLTQMFTRP